MNIFHVIALALNDSGIKMVTSVPGYGASESFHYYCSETGFTETYSFNEETAYTISHGAAVTGTRSASLVKSHGFLKAANSIVDSLYAGTTAGFVTIIFDDKEGSHSESIFDITTFVKGCRIPFHKAKPANVYWKIQEAVKESETMRLPVAVIVDEPGLTEELLYKQTRLDENKNIYKRDITKHLLSPPFAAYQSAVLEHKLSNTEWKDVPLPMIPFIPDQLPERYKQTAESYLPFFNAFKKIRGKIVTGDAGTSSLFALPPFNCIDITTYMGGSIPLAAGAFYSVSENVWAVTGDFSFIAAGQLGLTEVIARGLPLKIVILNNHRADATGGQTIKKDIINILLKGFEKNLHFINQPENEPIINKVLQYVSASNDLEIIIINF